MTLLLINCRKLTFPPQLAFGSEVVGDIPMNSVLTFEVELVQLQKRREAAPQNVPVQIFQPTAAPTRPPTMAAVIRTKAMPAPSPPPTIKAANNQEFRTIRSTALNLFPGEDPKAILSHQHEIPLPASPSGGTDGSGYSVCLVVVHSGPVPEYAPYFVAAAAASAPLVSVLLVLVGTSRSRSNSSSGATAKVRLQRLQDTAAAVDNVKVLQISAADLASRVMAAVGKDNCASGELGQLEAVLFPSETGGKKQVYGNKLNDIKPLYGALFESEMRSRWPVSAGGTGGGAFTHWGWADMDCIIGDLRPALLPHLQSKQVR
jgi:hypothetical protein